MTGFTLVWLHLLWIVHVVTAVAGLRSKVAGREYNMGLFITQSHHYLNDPGAAVWLCYPHSSCIVHEHCTLLHDHCILTPQKTVYVYGWVGMDYMHLNEGCVASFLVC